MAKSYTDEENAQILISLMKARGIRRVIASPGALNVTFVASIQQDDYFELFSAADERSAAYIACGLAEELGEPVALTCTGATASRNYIPGLTEAFYRKLPVLAITATQSLGRIGHNIPQMMDRTRQLNDMVLMSVQVPTIRCDEDRWSVETLINAALLELTHRGGGPVHVNLATTSSENYDCSHLPSTRVIERICLSDRFPAVPAGNVAIFIGSHSAFDQNTTQLIDSFCERYNAIVLCDQTSNYRGRYRVLGNLLANQDLYSSSNLDIDLLIHLGGISGSYMTFRAKEVWRVHPDGVIRDTFRKLTAIFEMSEDQFFGSYLQSNFADRGTSYFDNVSNEISALRCNIPELPFSNIWIAKTIAPLIPEDSVLHLGILNSLRAWNFFETPISVRCYSNTGGFGIDGCVSSLIGASLANETKQYFGVVGDLAFFYDMNSIGSRHVGKNLHLLVVNNGCGTEFRNYNHPAAKFGENADPFIAAAGHYGSMSPNLLKHYAEDLGFHYLAANSKGELLDALPEFLDSDRSRPVLLEAFTTPELESDALQLVCAVRSSAKAVAKETLKNALGARGVKTVKRIMGKE